VRVQINKEGEKRRKKTINRTKGDLNWCRDDMLRGYRIPGVGKGSRREALTEGRVKGGGQGSKRGKLPHIGRIVGVV